MGIFCHHLFCTAAFNSGMTDRTLIISIRWVGDRTGPQWHWFPDDRARRGDEGFTNYVFYSTLIKVILLLSTQIVLCFIYKLYIHLGYNSATEEGQDIHQLWKLSPNEISHKVENAVDIDISLLNNREAGNFPAHRLWFQVQKMTSLLIKWKKGTLKPP